MLKKLHISNYVLIKNLDVDFTNGLSIITGETGAGKSILLGALGLVLGERADAKTLFDKNKKCIIEAEFDISEYPLQQFFSENEIDYETQTIIRREINAEGKSRAFVNDTPVNLSLLKTLSSTLVDVHSQHQTLTVGNSSFQLNVTDALANHSELLLSYRENFNHYRQLQNTLNDLLEKEKQASAEFDFIQFQYEELNNANLKEGETETLEKELEILTHSESILKSVETARHLISEDEQNAVQLIHQSIQQLQQAAKYHTETESILKRLMSCNIELKDIASEMDLIQNNIHFNPERIEIISERLSVINHLLQKHRLKEVSNLLQLKDSLEQKLSGFNSVAEDIERIKKEIATVESTLNKQAATLSENRKEAAKKLTRKILKLLHEVALPDAQFEVSLTSLQHFSHSGLDAIRFLFSANKGVQPQELSKVASGGEMSRLMLCLKAILAEVTSMPTIIFDEIDTGISGETAFKVGNMIEVLAKKRQVIAITHLPQMASKGEMHYFVYKQTLGSNTETRVKLLSKEERIQEIAKMLSGEGITEASIENAKDLLLN
ncbi:MAG TPA: DNA repair protein RecN [Bacteroidia bacterium]|nr:DNA repair protein RecN [Bacteroidia bacterium]